MRPRLAVECHGAMDGLAMYTCLRTSLRIATPHYTSIVIGSEWLLMTTKEPTRSATKPITMPPLSRAPFASIRARCR